MAFSALLRASPRFVLLPSFPVPLRGARASRVPMGDHRAFLLRRGCEQMQDEGINVRPIGDNPQGRTLFSRRSSADTYVEELQVRRDCPPTKGVLTMSEFEVISRRKALSLGLAALFSLAAAPALLTVAEAEPQQPVPAPPPEIPPPTDETPGQQRRTERRRRRRLRRAERRRRRLQRRARRRERRTGRRVRRQRAAHRTQRCGVRQRRTGRTERRQERRN